MCAKAKQEAQNPLIIRCQRLIDAFAKSDDERDFYLDREEGFILFVDLDKSEEELNKLTQELSKHSSRYVLIPKLTNYEVKKIMEGFVNEKVYDIDVKEKLLDIIQSKDARDNFLEFIYDHHGEMEKWQQYYLERSRIRIIEWLRENDFHFVFEEDVELSFSTLVKVKENLFNPKVDREVQEARKDLFLKAKTYYSNEALNPKPKRGRPPKQIAKIDTQIQKPCDIYTTVSKDARPFLYSPDTTNVSFASFSTKFSSEEELLASRRTHLLSQTNLMDMDNLNQKLASLRSLSRGLFDSFGTTKDDEQSDYEEDEEEIEDLEEGEEEKEKEYSKTKPTKTAKKNNSPLSTPVKKPIAKNKINKRKKHIIPQKPVKKAPPKNEKKSVEKNQTVKRRALRIPIKKKTISSKKTPSLPAKKIIKKSK